MKIGYLGAGAWGFCLASLLASKGHEVVLWCQKEDFARLLSQKKEHPKLPGHKPEGSLTFTSNLGEALTGIDLLIESVTSSGLRSVLQRVAALGPLSTPLVITSKGIEQDSCLLLPEVALEVFGADKRPLIGCLSGPSLAEDVCKKLPTSVVSSAFDPSVMNLIQEAFLTPYFRVYPNSDINGVSFGGAMKNIIAIACGLSDGLGFGDNTKAALMTRGLHEIRKLSVTKSASSETLNGLAGLGDLAVTCLSKLSRNYQFGFLIAQGLSPKEAQKKIGMVVEGAYTARSALQIAHKAHIPVPITEVVYAIIYDEMDPQEAVRALLSRTTKEEHL